MRSDDEFIIIVQPVLRFLFAMIITLLLAGAGVAIVFSYICRTDAQDQRNRNERVSDYVSGLYREAEAASVNVQAFADPACSDETLRKLRHVAAINPHIRSINFYWPGRAGCSSLEGRLSPHAVSLPDNAPRFYTVMRQEEGYIFYLVYFRSAAGITGVALNGYFVREALRYISPEAAFYSLQDYAEKSPKGFVWKNPTYPFVIVSQNKPDISSLLSQSRLIILFILTVSLLTGWLVYLCTGLMNTPRYALKHHLRRHSFYPVYQPVICTKTNRIAGLEILMRCATRKGRQIGPSVFIPMAEQCGMMEGLTQSLLTCVESDLPLFAGRGVYLAVNITPDMILSADAICMLRAFTLKAGSMGIQVLAEITERQNICLTNRFTEKLAELRNAGLLIAIDDFGTGYANLSSIGQLNPDYLKIDKVFTAYSQTGSTGEALLESILHISANPSIPVIAEGIETDVQFNYMRDRGVWLFQGYLFSRPSDARRASDFIREYAGNAGEDIRF